MIYLIGGPSRSGKTILSHKLQKNTGANLLPMDYIEAAVTEYYPAEKLDELRPFSAMREKINKDNKKLVRQFSKQEIINAYEKQGRSTWAGIRAMINYELHRDDSIIIEGYQITPEFIDSVLREFGNKNIRIIFLVKENEEAILKGWKHAPSNDWLVQNSDEWTLQEYASLTAEYGKYFSTEAKKYNLMCINTDDDFEDGINEALALLLEKK